MGTVETPCVPKEIWRLRSVIMERSPTADGQADRSVERTTHHDKILRDFGRCKHVESSSRGAGQCG